MGCHLCTYDLWLWVDQQSRALSSSRINNDLPVWADSPTNTLQTSYPSCLTCFFPLRWSFALWLVTNSLAPPPLPTMLSLLGCLLGLSWLLSIPQLQSLHLKYDPQSLYSHHHEIYLDFINSFSSEELMEHSLFMKFLLEMSTSGMMSLNMSMGLSLLLPTLLLRSSSLPMWRSILPTHKLSTSVLQPDQ